MGVRCRLRGVSDDDEDNVYLHPSVVKQVINDLNELRRDAARKVSCRACSMMFVPVERDGVIKCPKGHVREKGDQD